VTYANVTDVADELGRPITTAEELAQVNAWLRRTEATIRTRVADLDARVTDGILDSALVSSIEAAVVARKVLNPEGKQNEKIDDYSYGRTPAAATVDLALTDHEWALLLPQPASPSAFSTRPHFEPDAPAEVWT